MLRSVEKLHLSPVPLLPWLSEEGNNTIGIILGNIGLYRDNGKENGNYRDYRGYRELQKAFKVATVRHQVQTMFLVLGLAKAMCNRSMGPKP